MLRFDISGLGPFRRPSEHANCRDRYGTVLPGSVTCFASLRQHRGIATIFWILPSTSLHSPLNLLEAKVSEGVFRCIEVSVFTY